MFSAQTDALGRRKRYASAPTGKALRPTEHRLAALAVLRRHRFLPSDYIGRLLNLPVTKGAYYLRLLGDLKREEYVYVPEAATLSPRYLNRPDVLSITSNGERYADDYGIVALDPRAAVPSSGHFAHDFGIDLIVASFELAALDVPGVRYISSTDVLNHPKCPESTSCEPQPFLIHKPEIKPDWGVHGFSYLDRAFFMMHGPEFDRGTESLQTIKHKFENYAQYLSARLYATRYGISNVTIPFVTTKPDRIGTMMELLKKTVEPRIAEKFAFKFFPDFHHFFPKPTAAMFTENWQRTSAPLNIFESLKQTAARKEVS